jgi:hypothetical protein
MVLTWLRIPPGATRIAWIASGPGPTVARAANAALDPAAMVTRCAVAARGLSVRGVPLGRRASSNRASRTAPP